MLITTEDAKFLQAALIYYKSFVKKTRSADSHEFDKQTIEKCEKWIKELDDHVEWRANAGLS